MRIPLMPQGIEHFKSLVFAPPFGARVEAVSYPAVSTLSLLECPQVALGALRISPSLGYMPASYERRGSLWFTGEAFGSTYQDDHDFLPRFKSRYKHVDPFVIWGFTVVPSPEQWAFVACGIRVWKGRDLLSVAGPQRDYLLRHTLACLVSNQPPGFLKEERLRLPSFLPLPMRLSQRRRLLDKSAPNDLYVVDLENPSWQVWCMAWLDT